MPFLMMSILKGVDCTSKWTVTSPLKVVNRSENRTIFSWCCIVTGYGLSQVGSIVYSLVRFYSMKQYLYNIYNAGQPREVVHLKDICPILWVKKSKFWTLTCVNKQHYKLTKYCWSGLSLFSSVTNFPIRLCSSAKSSGSSFSNRK